MPAVLNAFPGLLRSISLESHIATAIETQKIREIQRQLVCDDIHKFSVYFGNSDILSDWITKADLYKNPPIPIHKATTYDNETLDSVIIPAIMNELMSRPDFLLELDCWKRDSLCVQLVATQTLQTIASRKFIPWPCDLFELGNLVTQTHMYAYPPHPISKKCKYDQDTFENLIIPCLIAEIQDLHSFKAKLGQRDADRISMLITLKQKKLKAMAGSIAKFLFPIPENYAVKLDHCENLVEAAIERTRLFTDPKLKVEADVESALTAQVAELFENDFKRHRQNLPLAARHFPQSIRQKIAGMVVDPSHNFIDFSRLVHLKESVHENILQGIQAVLDCFVGKLVRLIELKSDHLFISAEECFTLGFWRDSQFQAEMRLDMEWIYSRLFKIASAYDPTRSACKDQLSGLMYEMAPYATLCQSSFDAKPWIQGLERALLQDVGLFFEYCASAPEICTRLFRLTR